MQDLRVVEAHEAKAPALPLVGGDGAVRRDLEAAFLRREGDRAVVAEDGVAVAGDELPLRVDLEGAVAGVALAGGRLHGEERVALDRHVERVARVLDSAGADVERRAGIDHVGQPAVGAWKRFRACHRHEVFAKARRARLEAVGGDVRHVVGDDVELTAERHLARQADEKRVLHERLPLCSPRRADPRRTLDAPQRGSGTASLAGPVPS